MSLLRYEPAESLNFHRLPLGVLYRHHLLIEFQSSNSTRTFVESSRVKFSLIDLNLDHVEFDRLGIGGRHVVYLLLLCFTLISSALLSPRPMQDPPFPIPSCFGAGGRLAEDLTTGAADAAAAARSGRSVVTSVYRTKIAGHCRMISVTWYRDFLSRGLSVSVDDEGLGSAAGDRHGGNSSCPVVSFKVEIRPWHFWRKHGSKRFQLDGRPVDFVWDLRRAKFSGEPEPQSGFFVAVASEHEVLLLLGDKKEAHQKMGCWPPATIDATLLSRREHVFGRTRFATRTRFQQKGGGRQHEIAVEYTGGGGGGNVDPEMVVRIDGAEAIYVKHLQWKFRGNECVTVGRARVDVYWDVHDWLFHPAGAGAGAGAGRLRHAVFIFKPVSFLASSSSMPLSSSSTSSSSSGSGAFCLFLNAWKLD